MRRVRAVRTKLQLRPKEKNSWPWQEELDGSWYRRDREEDIEETRSEG